MRVCVCVSTCLQNKEGKTVRHRQTERVRESERDQEESGPLCTAEDINKLLLEERNQPDTNHRNHGDPLREGRETLGTREMERDKERE